jgi:hypothetical protein
MSGNVSVTVAVEAPMRSTLEGWTLSSTLDMRMAFMALGFYFTPSGFTKKQYDEALRRLDAAGAGAPAGRSYHVAMEIDGAIAVFDVWDSQEAFEAFGATLIPIMAELGADPGQPMVAPVHNVIEA